MNVGALVKLWQKIALAAGGVFALFATRRKPDDDDAPPDVDDTTPTPPDGISPPPRPFNGIAFAVGDDPTWPLATTHKRGREVAYLDVDGTMHGNGSRRFGAHRKGPPAHAHQGVDLYANVHDAVIATEGGRITGLFNTFHLGTGAVVLVTDSGLTIVYGEIGRGTWADFGITKGMRVSKGQPLARVEKNSAGTWMLHFETYSGSFSTNDPPKSALLDPTLYLLTAAADESELA